MALLEHTVKFILHSDGRNWMLMGNNPKCGYEWMEHLYMIKLNPNLVVKQFYILLQNNNKYMMQLTQS